jgi:hypothetical protein
MSVGQIAGLRGRQPVKPPAERFAINFLHTYLLAPLGDPHYPIDVSGGITDWQMLGNGPDPTLTANGGQPVGDCTFAGRQHLRMAKAAAAGKVEAWETADELVSEYLAYDHGVDSGANIAEVLMYWFVAGKIRAFAPVDHSDPEACDAIMAAFHGLYVGVDLPDNANTQFASGEPWTLDDGDQPYPTDGHCIVKVRADGTQFDTWITWGTLQRSTREWTGGCIREAWAVITTEDEASMLHMPDLVADIVAASKKASVAPDGDDPDRNAGAAAFALGWQMAQLYGPLPQDRAAAPTDHLPSIAEYDTPARMDLAFDQLQSLLRRTRLGELEDSGHLDSCRTTDPDRRRDALRHLHFRILDTLDCADVRHAASYQLGRALSDVCWFPDTRRRLARNHQRVDVLFDQFSRTRLATLHGWLGQMSSLAPQTAPIVSRSLQNWSDWIDANAKVLGGHWHEHEHAVVTALRTQSDAWHQLLSSEQANRGQPPMGAWIHAGESILRGARAMVGKMLRWFWLVALLIVAATAGLLYLALHDAHGTAKVWTALLTVAGGISISGAGLRSGAAKLAGGLEQTAYQAADLDAQAWTITWLPSIHQGPVTRYRLHQRGVAPPGQARRPHRPNAASPPTPKPD